MDILLFFSFISTCRLHFCFIFSLLLELLCTLLAFQMLSCPNLALLLLLPTVSSSPVLESWMFHINYYEAEGLHRLWDCLFRQLSVEKNGRKIHRRCSKVLKLSRKTFLYYFHYIFLLDEKYICYLGKINEEICESVSLWI